jgi:hypothetical protein
VKINVGDKVRSKGSLAGLEGTVTRSDDWTSGGEPLSVENHGSIEILVEKITNSKCWAWLSVGDKEHFTHWNVDQYLEVISDSPWVFIKSGTKERALITIRKCWGDLGRDEDWGPWATEVEALAALKKEYGDLDPKDLSYDLVQIDAI